MHSSGVACFDYDLCASKMSHFFYSNASFLMLYLKTFLKKFVALGSFLEKTVRVRLSMIIQHENKTIGFFFSGENRIQSLRRYDCTFENMFMLILSHCYDF